MSSEKLHHAFFLIPPEVHLLDVFGPAHIFYEAKAYEAPIELIFLGIAEEQTARSSAGVSFNELRHFSDYQLNSDDWLIIPGLEAHHIFDESFIGSLVPFFEWLQRQHEHGAKICSVCTGAYLLAESKLLDGKTCTTHWKYLEDFTKRFPKTTLLKNRLFVQEHNLYSSAGVSSGIDLSLYLLEETFGSAFATKIAKEVVVYLRRSDDDPQLSVFLQYRNHLDDRVHQAQDFLSQNLASKPSVDSLAELVNMSPRNLTRLFKKVTGITISTYLDKLRVEKAVQLLLDGNKVDFVSTQCGLKSSNSLRSLLRKYKSILPNELLKLS